MEKKYLILFTVIGAAIAVYGFVTMQVVLAALLLVLVFLGALYVRIRSSPQGPESWNEGWSAAAGVAGIFVMLHVEFLLWAIAIAALLLIQQSLARIERRLEKLEKPEKP